MRRSSDPRGLARGGPDGRESTVDKALRAGRIDMYPDYIGTIVSVLAGKDPPSSQRATYAAARRYEQSNGSTLLDR